MSNPLPPHKVCPHCGQPAVLEMPACRRCGFGYSLQAGPPVSAASRREQPSEPVSSYAQTRTKQSRNLALATLLFFLLVGGASFGLYRIVHRVSSLANPMTAGAPPLPRPPVELRDPTGSTGMFNERPGLSEMPVLHVTGDVNDTMSLRLRDASGHEYRAVSRYGETVNLQVPPGEYAVYVESDNPSVHPNAGDATFRRFKEYDAHFMVSNDGSPFHLGD